MTRIDRWDGETQRVPAQSMRDLVYGRIPTRPAVDWEMHLFVILASLTAVCVAVGALILKVTGS